MLSTITGTPCSCAIVVIASRSGMLPAGLPMLSQNTAAVLSSIRDASAAALSSVANRTSMPMLRNVWANRV